jgi:tRNA(fMet)-specific endonuclease VapC
MAQLVDSSILIALERCGLPLSALAAVVSDEPLAIASITVSELLFGIYRADSRERRLRREAFIERVLDAVPVLPLDLAAARIHAEISAGLTADGRLIGAHDLIIAATALANGYAVLTDNVREFQRVAGLVVRRPNW